LSLNYAGAVQVGDFSGGHSEHGGQYLLGVLAEQGRRSADAGGRLAQFIRDAEQFDLSGAGMLGCRL